MAAFVSPRRMSAAAVASDDQSRPMIPRHHPTATLSLVQPSHRRRRPIRLLRLLRSLCRTLPIFTPKCKVPSPCKLPSTYGGSTATSGGGRIIPICAPSTGRRIGSNTSGARVTGTLFGLRRVRVSLCVQENSRCLPTAIFELAIQTHVLMREMSTGMVRIALETEKKPEGGRAAPLLDEPVWTMFCNGKKSGYGVRREATEEDLGVMELLRAVSMGAGVLPGRSDVYGPEAEMAYMRAHFEHVVGSRDSETLYMLGPDHGDNGPELTVFFVRV